MTKWNPDNGILLNLQPIRSSIFTRDLNKNRHMISYGIQRIGGVCVMATLFVFVLIGSHGFAADALPDGDVTKGESLFGANCASCHKVFDNSTGPKLQGAWKRWQENSTTENLFKWVKNSQALIAEGEPYAKQLFAEWGTVMTPQVLSDQDIVDIFNYVANAQPPSGDGAGDAACPTRIVEEEEFPMGALVLVIIFALVTFMMGAVRRQLVNAQKAVNEEEIDEEQTYWEIFAKWFVRNRQRAMVGFGFTALVVVVYSMLPLFEVGVFEDYEPSQPIAFSHSTHACKLEIDCKYCHHSVEKSKHAGIPSVNICMNCHKDIKKGPKTGEAEIAKIYEAAGWNVDKREYNVDQHGDRIEKPIVWNKAHNLPDHVYFNHSQHVKVGGLECEQCHGDVRTYELGRVSTSEEINAIEENKIKFTKPVLTMGWCIECHSQAQVQDVGNAYYDEFHKRLKSNPELTRKYMADGKLVVREIGGWECAKCHY